MINLLFRRSSFQLRTRYFTQDRDRLSKGNTESIRRMSMLKEIFVPLDDIIGDTTHLTCEHSVFSIRGLSVKCWKYSNKSVAQQKTPVIAVHGGPAFTHNYMLPLKLICDDGFPVIFYDQCGCGDSTVVRDPAGTAPWLLTIEYYVQELAAVVTHFNLSEYYLYGSSWGTVILLEYAVAMASALKTIFIPRGLQGLVLDGALCDGQVYIQTQWRDRISTLPTFTQKMLKQIVETKAFDSPLARQMDQIIGYHFTCRSIPRPDCLERSFEKANLEIYRYIQGPSEFSLEGVLENWSITDRLKLVRGI